MLRIKYRRIMARQKAQSHIKERTHIQNTNRNNAYFYARSLEKFLRQLRTRPNFVRKVFNNQLMHQYGSLYKRFEKAFRFGSSEDMYQEYIKYIWHLYEFLKPYINIATYRMCQLRIPFIETPVIAHNRHELDALGYKPIIRDYVFTNDLLMTTYPIYL